MANPNHKIPPPGRGAARWFLFLSFFHLLPVPWFLIVAGGLAPASFIFAAGMASLFSSGRGTLNFAVLLLASALVSGLIFYLATWLLTRGILKMSRQVVRTATLAGLLAVCLIAAMNPIFIQGGHSGSSRYSLFEFIKVLDDFRIPTTASFAYFSGLAVLLLGLLGYQHLAARQAPISVQKWQRRRRIRRRVLAGSLLTLVVVFCWTQRIILVVKPLAEMGIASAQYRLAMAISERDGAKYGSDVSHRDWLALAAEQGHSEAAMLLALRPRAQKEKLRWLKVAAEGGMAEAQYQLYLLLLKVDAEMATRETARDWLEKAANNEQMDAQYDLGRYYLNGHVVLGIEKNLTKAQQWWERAADSGQGQAMEELARRYKRGTDGFPQDPQRAIELLNLVAEGYQYGRNGLPQNQQLADVRRHQAKRLATREEQLARGDPQAQAKLGRELLRVSEATPETVAEGLMLLEKAASQGDPQLQYELGGIFLFGRHGLEIDLPRGRGWWAKALKQNHVETMEDVAPAYQNGRFGYPVDLLKSKALVRRLVEAYRDGLYGVVPDTAKARYWSKELKYFDRLFELSGGSYQAPKELQPKAESGDPRAQYQLGRQMMFTGPAGHRQQGLKWIERAAEGGYAKAQFEHQARIMRNDPARGVTLLQAAAEQNHLHAMSALALGHEKGRYGLTRNYSKAIEWYERLLKAYESGDYLGNISEHFIPTQRRFLTYATKALGFEIEKARRYEAASPLEKKIIKVEEHYRIEYQNAVNALDRRDGSPAGKKRIRAEMKRLREKYTGLREEEIARNKGRGNNKLPHNAQDISPDSRHR